MYPYPGDHPDKKAARLFLYKHALSSTRQGFAITLAGHSPETEVCLLRSYLRWPAKRVLFIDRSKDPRIIQALRNVKSNWPEVDVRSGDLLDFLEEHPRIGFANLDFMGHLNLDNVVPCLKAIGPLMVSGGILGLTWERGRELRGKPRSPGALILSLGSEQRALNDQRWSGVIKAVNLLTDSKLEFIGGVEYQNNHSPMSVTVLRKK